LNHQNAKESSSWERKYSHIWCFFSLFRKRHRSSCISIQAYNVKCIFLLIETHNLIFDDHVKLLSVRRHFLSPELFTIFISMNQVSLMRSRLLLERNEGSVVGCFQVIILYCSVFVERVFETLLLGDRLFNLHGIYLSIN
jgi:hypothetical protein